MWRVVNVHAAQFAVEVFRHAAEGVCYGEALRRAREFSHGRARDGEPYPPHLAYRYFGDPNEAWPDLRAAEPAAPRPPESAPASSTEPEPEPATTSPISPPPPASATRIFDARGRLLTAVFTFEIDGVLLRAAKRRNWQGRAQVTITDFLTGMMRVGELTRFVLRRAGLDLQALYDEIGERPEISGGLSAMPPDSALPADVLPDAAALRALLLRWIVRQRDDFAPDLVVRLEAAAPSADGTLAEQAVLEVLLDSPAWAALGAGVPTPDAMRAILADREGTREVDENGTFPLDELTPAAREIIRSAHQLARQSGATEIKNRALLAAFIGEADGFAARVCVAGGVDPKLLWALLRGLLPAVSLPVGDAGPALDYGLSPAVCAHIVAPAIEQARSVARDPHAISEEELFRAFCAVADPGFADFLREPAEDEDLEPVEADLAELRTIDPEQPGLLAGLTLRARLVVRRAHRLAQQRRLRPIPNRLLLAGFLIEQNAFAHRVFARHHLSARRLCEILIVSAAGNAPADYPFTGEACARIVAPAIARARELAGTGAFITERLLFRAFCEIAEPQMKVELKKLGVDLDLLGTSDADGPPLPPPEPPLSAPHRHHRPNHQGRTATSGD